jgi:hypothetical protein
MTLAASAYGSSAADAVPARANALAARTAAALVSFSNAVVRGRQRIREV